MSRNRDFRSKSRLVLVLLIIGSVIAAPASAIDPGTAITAVSTGVDLMKEMNAQNRSSAQGRQLADVIGRLDYMQQHLNVIEQKIDVAIAGIHRLEERQEEQWQRALRAKVFGAIDSVHQYYPGWRKACVRGQQIACDEATKGRIGSFHANFVQSVAEFRRLDDYSNIHLAMLATGYERDLLTLLGDDDQLAALYAASAAYLKKGIPYIDGLRRKVEREVATLENNAGPWNTTGDYCATNETVFIDHGGGNECRYCVVRYFRGSYLSGQPYEFQNGFVARDGQGSDGCINRSKPDRDGPKRDRDFELISYRPTVLASYSPIGDFSCEYAREHRNCATLQSILATRSTHNSIKNRLIPQIDAFTAEVRSAISRANELAGQR